METTRKAVHHMQLHPNPFAEICSGRKKSEIRLYNDKRRLLSSGDHIVFTNREDGKTISVLVTDLTTFPTFAELYRASKSEFLPLSETEFVGSLLEYYSPTLQETHGVVRIGIANLE